MRGFWIVLACAGVLLGAKLAQELYRWVAYSEERVLLLQLRDEVVDAGAEIIRTTLRADSLQHVIEADDRALRDGERAVERYGRFARGGALPGHLYEAYRAEVAAFRRDLAARNGRVEEWNALVDQRRELAARYDTLADSARAVAARMGDPYFPVPLPAEAALERGIAPPAAPPAGRAAAGRDPW